MRLSWKYLDMNGFPVERPKSEYPYSYSPYRIYRRCYMSSDKGVDSDRMFQQDSEKFDSLCLDIWGNTSTCFGNRLPEEIQLFLERYFDKRILLTGIMEACNFATGYPYWTFFYREV